MTPTKPRDTTELMPETQIQIKRSSDLDDNGLEMFHEKGVNYMMIV